MTLVLTCTDEPQSGQPHLFFSTPISHNHPSYNLIGSSVVMMRSMLLGLLLRRMRISTLVYGGIARMMSLHRPLPNLKHLWRPSHQKRQTRKLNNQLMRTRFPSRNQQRKNGPSPKTVEQKRKQALKKAEDVGKKKNEGIRGKV